MERANELEFEGLFKAFRFEVLALRFEDIRFNAYVQLKCQHCVNYGSSYRCPPNTPRFYEAREILKEHAGFYFVLRRDRMTEFKQKLKLRNNAPDIRLQAFTSLHWDRISYWSFNKGLLAIKRGFESCDLRAYVFGAGGGCRLCRICGLHKRQPCKHLSDSLASPESWGIDVYGTLLAKGIFIEIPPSDVFTRVGLVCSQEKLKSFRGDMNEVTYFAYKFGDSATVSQKLTRILNVKEAELPNGCLVDITPVQNYAKMGLVDFCENCCNADSFLCDRTFLPFCELRDYLNGRHIITLHFKSKTDLRRGLWRWIDFLHRKGFWSGLPFSNNRCDTCDDCSTDGCKLTNMKNQKKFGRKEAWRCIRYIGIQPGFKDDNIGFIVV